MLKGGLRNNRAALWIAATAMSSFLGCGDNAPAGTGPDAGSPADASPAIDADTTQPDASEPDAGTPVVPEDTDPSFAGLTSVSTAGGTSAQIDWDAGFDNETLASELIYRVYASTTSGGQDFGAPIATTAAGEVSIVVSDADSALLAEGNTVYFVVRAVDLEGNEDDNTVEGSVTFVSPTTIAYVSDEAAGAGTLGDPTAPFATIQQGILAVEAAGGGLVLVDADPAGTAYAEELNLTGAVSTIGVFGGFARFSSLAAGADAATVLASRDVTANPTSIAGATLEPLVDDDLIRVNNGGSATTIDGFTLSALGASANAVNSIGGDIRVSNTVFQANTSFVANATDAAIGHVRLVGNTVTGIGSNAFTVGGNIGHLEVSNNTVRERSNAIRTSGSLVSALVVPSTGTTVHVAGNRFRDTSTSIDLNFEPLDEAAGGDLAIVIADNDLRDSSSNAIDIEGFAAVGENGGASLVVRDNQVIGASSDCIELDYSGLNTPYAGVDTNVEIANNELLGSNSIPVDIDLMVSAGREANLAITDNFISGSESELFEISDRSGALNTSDEGDIAIVIARNTSFSAEDLEIEVGMTHGGQTTIDIVENTTLGSEDEAIVVDVEGYLGSTDVVREFPDGQYFINIFNNDFHGGDDEALDFSDERADADLSAMYGYIGHNYLADSPDPSSSVGVELRFDESNSCMLIESNLIGIGGADSEAGLNIILGPVAVNSELQVRNNVVTLAHGPGIDVESRGTQPQLINNTVAFNGENGRFGIESNTPESQAFIHNSIVALNAAGDLGEGLNATYSLVEDGVVGVGFGSIVQNPIFDVVFSDLEFPATNDSQLANLFSLAPASPAIDAGDPKAMYLDPDGSRNDMGAFGGPAAGPISFGEAGAPIPMVFLGTTPAFGLYSGNELLADTGALTLAFTQPVDEATLAAGVTFSNNGAAIAGTFEVSAGGRLATFTPNTTLTSGGDSIVEVALTNSLTSADGLALAYPSVVRFGVAQVPVAETEPNDVDDLVIDAADIATAQDLAFGPAAGVFGIEGSIATSTDFDLYSLSIDAGSRISLSVFQVRQDALTGGARLLLVDDLGNVVATGGAATFNQDPYLDIVVAESGTYHIVVTSPAVTVAEDYVLQGVLD